MKLTKTVTLEVEVTDDVLCNYCGESLIGEGGNQNGLVETEVHGGFDSTGLGDGDRFTFSICEKCLLELFKDFLIPPQFSSTRVYCKKEEK